MAGPLPPPPLLMAWPLREELFFVASLRLPILLPPPFESYSQCPNFYWNLITRTLNFVREWRFGLYMKKRCLCGHATLYWIDLNFSRTCKRPNGSIYPILIYPNEHRYTVHIPFTHYDPALFASIQYRTFVFSQPLIPFCLILDLCVIWVITYSFICREIFN